MTEFVCYGGKGGVGKTTVAAASGLRLAEGGLETLVVSTDPAHSLSDAVETDLGGDPTRIRGDLYGVEVDPQTGVDRYRALFEALADEFEAAGVRMDEEEIADLFSAGVAPGSDELAALEGLATYLEADRWDRVVLDTAPTGHTLRLLDLPSVLDRGLSTALDLRSRLRRTVDAARTMVFGPMAARGTDAPEDLAALRERMERVEAALTDPERTAFRVVTVPETMAVRESERLVDSLREFGVPVTTVVANRVIEDPGDCPRCRAKVGVQAEALDRLSEAFPDLDLWTVPDDRGEVTGLADLERVGSHLGRDSRVDRRSRGSE